MLKTESYVTFHRRVSQKCVNPGRSGAMSPADDTAGAAGSGSGAFPGHRATVGRHGQGPGRCLSQQAELSCGPSKGAGGPRIT